MIIYWSAGILKAIVIIIVKADRKIAEMYFGMYRPRNARKKNKIET